MPRTQTARLAGLVSLQYQTCMLDAEVGALARSLKRRGRGVPDADADLRRLRWFRRVLRLMVAKLDDAAPPVGQQGGR
jgi:hypothetical protein